MINFSFGIVYSVSELSFIDLHSKVSFLNQHYTGIVSGLLVILEVLWIRPMYIFVDINSLYDQGCI